MLVFGISKAGQLIQKAQREDFPVFMVLPRPAEAVKTAYRLEFNNYAATLMYDFDYTIGQVIDEETNETKHFFVRTSYIPAGITPNFKFRVCSNRNVNSQKLWKYIRESFNNENELMKFRLVETEVEGITVFLFEPYEPNVTPTQIHLVQDITPDVEETPVDENFSPVAGATPTSVWSQVQ